MLVKYWIRNECISRKLEVVSIEDEMWEVVLTWTCATEAFTEHFMVSDRIIVHGDRGTRGSLNEYIEAIKMNTGMVNLIMEVALDWDGMGEKNSCDCPQNFGIIYWCWCCLLMLYTSVYFRCSCTHPDRH